MAEAVFQRMIDEEGLGDKIEVDSAGTGSWHVGEMAHRGTRRVLEEHGIPYSGRARQIARDDLSPNTYIIAMAQSNIDELGRRFGDHPRLFRLLEFAEDAEALDVPDPYYTGNFEYVYQLVEEGCRGLLEYIREQEGI
jgi:protein-tyrosine phosphatase